jgi:hypothetical protein
VLFSFEEEVEDDDYDDKNEQKIVNDWDVSDKCEFLFPLVEVNGTIILSVCRSVCLQ